MLREGEQAPDFTLKDQQGRETRLRELLRNKRFLILYFYPRDDTPGCTKEACAFRDSIERIRSLGAEVAGISVDSPESHAKFASKYSLPFTLLSDSEGKVARLFGAYSEERKRCLRKTYIIDSTGKIIKTYSRVKPDMHAEEIVEFLRNL